MAKLTYEDKKEIVRLYDEEHFGYIAIAKQMNVGQKVIDNLIRRYHIHGEKALVNQSTNKFTSELKFEIISRVLQGDSKRSTAVLYNIDPSQIRLWLKKYEKFGYNGLIDKPKGRPPNMKKEKKTIDPNDKDAVIKSQADRILELEAEVEALKKLRALVLQRNEQQTKKKQ